MTLNQYSWKDGPDVIQQHSVAKHRILSSYLAAYFKTLVSSPTQDELRLTLVDGFAGGGLYYHSDTKEMVDGSPFIFLEATKEAEFWINKDRHNKVDMRVDYFFVESNKHAHLHLDKVLRQRGYGPQIDRNIFLRQAKFHDEANSIIEFIKKKSPRNGRAIFSLDQYGYKDVPTELVRKIFSELRSAEVILTFGVDSFINFASDNELTNHLLRGIGIPDVLQGRAIEDIKGSERHWRLFIQSALYRSLVERCGARYYTPFFIRNRSGHGDYWLIHLSQHHRARDVMTEVHWANNNHFIHYGGAGLDMFQMVGYDPSYDQNHSGQTPLGFEFDDVARRTSVATLSEQIPHLVYANPAGISFGELFATTCNGSPASAQIYRESLGKLLNEKVVEIVGADGTQRRSTGQTKASDQILPPTQKHFFLRC